MVHEFSIKLDGKNSRKLIEILKFVNFSENENIFDEIKKTSETYKYNDKNFSEIFETNKVPSEKILRYLNFIDDFYGYVVFSDKKSLDAIEALILYYIDNDLLPIKIFFSMNSDNLFSLKKFTKNFVNKYKNLKYNYVLLHNNENLKESKENIYLIPLNRSFKFINYKILDIGHKSSIFYNFFSSNLYMVKKELEKSEKNEFSVFPFNYYNRGIFEFLKGYRTNLIPVSVVENSNDVNLIYYLYNLCFKINFNAYCGDIYQQIKIADIFSEKSRAIAKLIGLYINLPEFDNEKMCS